MGTAAPSHIEGQPVTLDFPDFHASHDTDDVRFFVSHNKIITVSTDLWEICSLTRRFRYWVDELKGDEDDDFLLRGVAEGFRITKNIQIPPIECKN